MTNTAITFEAREYALAQRRAYARGYNAGSRNHWPEHKPPLPPDALIGSLIKAAQELRDEVDTQCAMMYDEDDEFCGRLYERVDAVDEIMVEITTWLKKPEAESCAP